MSHIVDRYGRAIRVPDTQNENRATIETAELLAFMSVRLQGPPRPEPPDAKPDLADVVDSHRDSKGWGFGVIGTGGVDCFCCAPAPSVGGASTSCAVPTWRGR